jgi:hypothetical protein
MTDHGLAEVIGAAGIFVLLTVIVWQFAATWRARSVLARETEYRALVESVNRQLGDLGGQVGQVQLRLDSIEHVLKDVE